MDLWAFGVEEEILVVELVVELVVVLVVSRRVEGAKAEVLDAVVKASGSMAQDLLGRNESS